jgi:uncharacterized damage-inducible protein DinB
MARPDLARVPEFYHRYINTVKTDDLMLAIKNQSTEIFRFLNEIPANKRNYRYAEGKWTIKDIVQHLIDAERIFCYRSLCFARKDANSLPGFDEVAYADNAKAESRDWDDLINEFRAVRQASEFLYDSFSEEQLKATGTANGNPIYVNALGFIIVGHVNHHVGVIRERYLSELGIRN